MTTSKPTTSPSDEGASRSFARAYQEWLAARAEEAGLCAIEGDIPDDECDRALHRMQNAGERLATTPAVRSFQVFQKFAALEALIADSEIEGNHNARRHLLMLASLKADLLHFDLSPTPQDQMDPSKEEAA